MIYATAVRIHVVILLSKHVDIMSVRAKVMCPFLSLDVFDKCISSASHDDSTATHTQAVILNDRTRSMEHLPTSRPPPR